MYIAVETQAQSDRESFRLLQWERSVAEVDLVGTSNTRRSIQGLGGQLHMHAEAEVTLVLEGGGRLIVGDYIGQFQGPEILVVGPNVPHCWNAAGPSNGCALQFPVESRHALPQLSEWTALVDLLRLAGRGLRIQGDYALSLKPLFQQMIESTDLGRIGLFFIILERVNAMLDVAECLSTKAYSGDPSTIHFRGIRSAISSILQNYSKRLDLAHITQQVGMSKALFCREFKRYTGRTFVEFVNEVRVDAVCQELLQSDKLVLDIALDCGFGNLSNFNRTFRKVKGMSPVAYKRCHGSR